MGDTFSVPHNEDLSETMAKLYKNDKDQSIRAVIAEIHVLERSHNRLENKVRDLETQVAKFNLILTGINGDNGLNGTIKELSKEVQSLKKSIFMGFGIIACISTLLPYLLHRL